MPHFPGTAFLWREWGWSQALAGLIIPIVIEIGVPLPQEFLGSGMGTDLAAAAPAATVGGVVRDAATTRRTAEVS